MKLHTALPALALLATTGCTLAQMRPPAAPPERTEATLLQGTGHGRHGAFTLADSRGSYTRDAAYAWFGDVAELRGSASFVASGDAITGELSGQCRSAATDAGSGSIVVRTRQMAYRCRYARDRRPIDARLVIDEPIALLDERRGHIDMNGIRIDLKSEHHLVGSSMPVASPMGYIFSVNGQVIGGIDLNGAAKRVFLPRAPELREAALAAALSLALFIDAEVGEATDDSG